LWRSSITFSGGRLRPQCAVFSVASLALRRRRRHNNKKASSATTRRQRAWQERSSLRSSHTADRAQATVHDAFRGARRRRRSSPSRTPVRLLVRVLSSCMCSRERAQSAECPVCGVYRCPQRELNSLLLKKGGRLPELGVYAAVQHRSAGWRWHWARSFDARCM
jgi:hypothetical protein